MKNSKRIFALCLTLVLAVSLVACGTPAVAPAAAPAATPAAPKAELVVAGVVFQEDQFMKTLTQGYIDAAKAAGVKCLTGNTSNDAAKEVELINTYMTQKVSGLAIAPLDPKTSEPALKKANDAGMKIAITNMDLSSAPYIVGGFTSDNANIGAGVGAAAAKFITEKLGGKANIAILQFKSQVPAQSKARVDGFKSEVEKLGAGVKFVADQDAWLQDKAIGVVNDILTAHPDVNLIYAANDGGTIGATMAVKNAGKAGKIFVFGIDVGQQQIDMVKSTDNILQAVNGQDPYQMGYKAMEALIKVLKGETVTTMGKTTIVNGVLLSRDDPASITKAEGK
jgi:ABC-type sugar transport system substrate-binding protein